MNGSSNHESPKTIPTEIGISGNQQISMRTGIAGHFQGSAWEYDEATDEYYLRLFCKEQPDLNWDNTAVRKAAHDVMRFWLNRKIDGFRIDVINFISKDLSFPDSSQRFLRGTEYYASGPRCHEYLQEIGAIFKE
ncbi:hypothetical protein E4U17_003658 [Claviceps sp. LM77 group G4]|nr:hypothetical protein E4U17_003658 [Claviceps sp. LM77 group G4]KAG6071262.1 hypothetical protein E4U33_003811 [Claviceps sp. LM78 group G4]KAG6074442.1 hypothetical protein E4U16_003939 [Claviceps sp. LM84 group G4]